MRWRLKAYVGLVAAAATLLWISDLRVLPTWPHAWSLELVVALGVLAALGDQLQFEVRRGWYTNASAVPHVAAAFLLPPGLAMAIGGLGTLARAARHPLPLPKLVFNVASIGLSVAAAAHVADRLGGPDLVRTGGSWSDPLTALLASAAYYGLSTTLVAIAVAFDQRRSFWEVTRGKVGVKAVGEIGLGLIGATLAVMLMTAPNWAPLLLVPALLLYFAKRSMDRADRRSRNLTVTSAVGRAVAGTLDPENAFEAITGRRVRDDLKLDGLALLPIDGSGAFGPHIATDVDQPILRRALLEALAREPRQILMQSTDPTLPDGRPARLLLDPVSAVAIPFGAGLGRPVGGLLAWRAVGPGRAPRFEPDELLVLETLADYAAVALETARLAQETARLHHEAGQAEARREMESLREVARLKDEFLGQVSHELRTPLTIIHGYSELMVDGLMLDPALARQSAEEIHTSSTLMLRLVDDLLDTSRLDAGRIELKTTLVDLAAWLARTTTAFAQATSSHQLVAALPKELPPVSADLDRLGQVMNNLLSNAVRYSPAGTQISVTAELQDEAVEIQVSDQGPGIAPEDCARIFEKFYRGKNGATLAVRGTGLGLAVARQLIEAHGGSIGVRSTLGQGSTFWVRLPLAETTSEPSAEPISIAPQPLALSA